MSEIYSNNHVTIYLFEIESLLFPSVKKVLPKIIEHSAIYLAELRLRKVPH